MPSFRILGLLVCVVMFSCASLRADNTPPMESSSSDPDVHIFFKGYQKTPNGYVFQLYLMDLPANQQPGLKKMGDPVGVKGYVISNFSVNIFKTSVGDSPPTSVDASTLELIDLKANRKAVLTYHSASQPPQ